MDLPESFTLTSYLLMKLMTPAGGYTKATLAALGIKWPPAGGWMKTIVGLPISRKKYEKAMAGRTKKIVGGHIEGKVDPLKHVEIWTDGSCQPNPGGNGGWGAIMKFGEHVRELSGPVEGPTTNNRCELLAVINALKEIKHTVRITLRTDSKYVIQVIGGCKARANADLAREIRELAAQHAVTCEWVKGHNGDPNNERCDKLADEQRKTLEKICPEPLPIDPPKSVREWQSRHTLINDDARRERQRLQLEIDRAIGF